MKIKFPLTPGEYLFFTGLIYFVVGMVDIFYYRFTEPEYIQVVWILILMLPVIVPIPKVMQGSPFWRK